MAELESFDVEKREDSTEPAAAAEDNKGLCEKFFNNCTFNGARYAFASKSWPKRIIWGVMALVAIAGFSTVTVKDITSLASEPTSTSTTLTKEKKLNFPAVTICSLGVLDTDVLERPRNIFSPSAVDYLGNLFAKNHSNVEGCKTTANNLARYTGHNVSWGELTSLAKYNLKDLIMECSFVGKNCIDDFEPINTVGGVCYTFNGPSTKTLTAQGTGIRQGLRLRLFANNQRVSLGSDRGYRIVIHNPDELPRPESEGIVVGLGSTVYIGMRQIVELSSGHRCKRENINQKLSFPNYPSYSPSLCESECFYTFVADQCNCTETMLYTPVSSRYDQRECKLPDICCEFEAFSEVNDSCDCPPKCKTISHALTISSSTSANDLVGVNIFYDSLNLETRETTNSYTPLNLISDIGGNTGLFLGFSLLSGVELLMLVVGLIKDWFYAKFKIEKLTSKLTSKIKKLTSKIKKLTSKIKKLTSFK